MRKEPCERQLNMPQENTLTVINRVEAGCLGPNGKNLVQAFCVFAQQEFDALGLDFVLWEVVPREDKSWAELEYRVNRKKLSRDQAQKYLNIFEENIDEFESLMGDVLTNLIEEFTRH